MITLYKFGPIGDVCDASPFCVKVEAYLKMAKLPYQSLCGPENLRKAPKGKLPFIDDGGKIVADSSFILHYLKTTYGNTLDQALTPEQQATAHAFTKMIDENLYWTLVHARWILPHNQPALRSALFGKLPFPLNKIVPVVALRQVRAQLHGHGIGRHSDQEIADIGDRDLAALSAFLGAKPYFFGEQATSLDAAAYGILAEMIKVTAFTAPVFERAKAYPNLVAFTERFHQAYFQSPA